MLGKKICKLKLLAEYTERILRLSTKKSMKHTRLKIWCCERWNLYKIKKRVKASIDFHIILVMYEW